MGVYPGLEERLLSVAYPLGFGGHIREEQQDRIYSVSECGTLTEQITLIIVLFHTLHSSGLKSLEI